MAIRTGDFPTAEQIRVRSEGELAVILALVRTSRTTTPGSVDLIGNSCLVSLLAWGDDYFWGLSGLVDRSGRRRASSES
jgi:hypothetical protein